MTNSVIPGELLKESNMMPPAMAVHDLRVEAESCHLSETCGSNDERANAQNSSCLLLTLAAETGGHGSCSSDRGWVRFIMKLVY